LSTIRYGRKENIPFAAELLLGHLRYGTYGKNDIESVHPVMRVNNWKTRNLLLAGNFNLTNVDELFQILIDLGQHPRDFSDTVTMLENIGHFLDREIQRDFDNYKKTGHENVEISELISENLRVDSILRESSKKWDGGYVIAGLLGHGDAFVLRDPWGIRPAFYYMDEELVVVASERPAIQTALNIEASDIRELDPGSVLVIKKSGKTEAVNIRGPYEKEAARLKGSIFHAAAIRISTGKGTNWGNCLHPKSLRLLTTTLRIPCSPISRIRPNRLSMA